MRYRRPHDHDNTSQNLTIHLSIKDVNARAPILNPVSEGGRCLDSDWEKRHSAYVSGLLSFISPRRNSQKVCLLQGQRAWGALMRMKP